MQRLVLDATNKSITCVMSGAAATTNPDFSAHWIDHSTGNSITEGANDGALNGTTAVTLVAAPASSTQRVVGEITIQNRDTAAVTITLRYVDGASTRQLWSGTLQVGDTWTLAGVLDTNGNMKYTTPTGVTSVTASAPIASSGGSTPNISLTGKIPLANGGTNADLSGTGGANQFLKQTSVGGNISVATITEGDLPHGTSHYLLGAQIFS